jgi:hypothetical protein
VRWTLLVVSASLLLAQSGTEPKSNPTGYEAHAQARSAAVGAEFLIHSFSGHDTSGHEVTYIAPDFLVVEVALYPPKGTGIDVQPLAFTLRLNGKKMLSPASISLVASSLEHPEWRPGPRLEAGAGMGDGGVILGAPRPSSPIPGQPPPERPLPGPDEDPKAAGVSRTPRVPAGELLVQTALPEGKTSGPVSGYLYFPFRGKPGSLKAVELLFEDAVLKLR